MSTILKVFTVISPLNCQKTLFIYGIFLGFFTTKIFHPNVASNGEICVNTLKKDWKSDLGIKHILLVQKFVFMSHKITDSFLV